MKCENCGVINEEDAIYCINCGNKLDNSQINVTNSNYSIKPISVKETFVHGLIIAIFVIFAIILSFTYPVGLFLILSITSWVWIIIFRFKSFTSRRYFYYILSRIIGVIFLLLILSLHNSKYLIGSTVYSFYIAIISFLATCAWLSYKISQDKNIIKMILT